MRGPKSTYFFASTILTVSFKSRTKFERRSVLDLSTMILLLNLGKIFRISVGSPSSKYSATPAHRPLISPPIVSNWRIWSSKREKSSLLIFRFARVGLGGMTSNYYLS